MSNSLSRPSFGVALTVLVAALALQAAGTAHAQTDPVAEFYKGKTVSILVGYEGGGGWVRQSPGEILYYKNNTGLAIQFAACGAILYKKLIAEGTNRTIPRDWFASQKYSIPPAG